MTTLTEVKNSLDSLTATIEADVIDVRNDLTALSDRIGVLEQAAVTETGVNSTLRIAVVCDGIGVFPWGQAWPYRLNDALQQAGLDAQVTAVGLTVMTHFRAQSSSYPVANGKSVVDYLVDDLRPHVVIDCLGAQDGATNPDSRTEAQISGDVANFITAVQSGLPNAYLCYGRQVLVDEDNFPFDGTTSFAIKNKGVPPLIMDRGTAALDEAGCYTDATLDQNISATGQAIVDRWRIVERNINNQYAALGAGRVFNMHTWRPMRLGLQEDSLFNLANPGHMYLLSDAYGFLRTTTQLTAIYPALALMPVYGDFVNYDMTWYKPSDPNYGAVLPDGDGWKINPIGFYRRWASAWMFNPDVYFGSWFRPSKVDISSRNLVDANNEYIVHMNDLPPKTEVQFKFWDSAGGSEPASYISGPSGAVFTSETGSFLNVNELHDTVPPSGTYKVKYKIGDQVFGPLDITVV